MHLKVNTGKKPREKKEEFIVDFFQSSAPLLSNLNLTGDLRLKSEQNIRIVETTKFKSFFLPIGRISI